MTANQGYTVTYSMDGTNYQASPVFNGLAKGSYDVWIKKENNFHTCETQKTIEVKQLIYLDLQASTDFSCEGASNMIIAQVDPIYEGQVTYILDNSISQSTGIFENVGKGSHTVTVKHNDYGCADAPITLQVEEYRPLSIELVNSDINEYMIQASGGEPGYEYSFDSDTDFGPSNVLDLKPIGESRDYTFYVRDQKGCVAEKTVFIEFLDIEIPDFFTPQGDYINDTWYPINIELYPNISVKTFDRYQRLIASYQGNTHSWDGNYKGKPLPSGDYWYVVRLNDTGDNREFKGNFSLVR